MNIKDILYKACLLKTRLVEALVIPFNILNMESLYYDSTLKKEVKKNNKVIHYLNLDATIETGQMQIGEMSEEIAGSIEMVVLDPEDILNELVECSVVINQQAKMTQITLDHIFKILGTINKILEEDSEDENLGINLKIKHMFTEASSLNESDKTRVIKAIRSIIQEYEDKDLDDPEVVSKLKNRLHMTIIDALPPSVSVEDIDLNLSKIIEVLKERNNENE